MRALVQRSLESSVSVRDENGNINLLSSIDKGLVVLLGVQDRDEDKHIQKLADKIEKLRIFNDDDGKMNLSIKEVGGSILLVSQFTLYANCKKGNRPSFIEAGEPTFSEKMYEKMAEELRSRNLEVGMGQFGGDMLVKIQNDGPITIWLDTDELVGDK